MFFRTIAVVGLLTLAGCSATTSAQQLAERGQLFNDTWHLVRMDKTRREDIEKYQGFTLMLRKDKLSGNAFNAFTVDAKVFSDGTMQVGRNFTATRMLPMGRERILEKAYFSSILSAQHWDKVNGQLILTTAQGKLIFRQ